MNPPTSHIPNLSPVRPLKTGRTGHKTNTLDDRSETANIGPRQFSLSFVVTFWTAAAIALSMAFYAVMQQQLHPDMTVVDLVLHHLWHVLALGAVINLTLWLGFRRFLWRPLMQIFMHLYGVGKGRLAPLRVNSRIRELTTIADGINLMIWRMGREIDPEAIDRASRSLANLRGLLAPLTGENPDLFNEISKQLEEIEHSLLALAQTMPAPAAAS